MNENKKPTVALIFGGRGCEDRVSRRGRDHILPMIDKNTYSVREVFIDKDGRWLLDGVCEVFPFKGGFFSPKRNEMTPVDCAIPLLHGDFGEDGRVQGALDCADIPYIGCDSRVGALCRDKAVVKMIAATLDIPALPFLLLLRNEGMDYAVRRVEENLTYPVIIKPTALGSSVGVARVDKRESLRDELKKLFALTDRVIAEPCLDSKRELECGYFSAGGKEIFTNPGEILLDGLYGYEEKYISGSTGLSIRADLPAETVEMVREYSRRLVRTLGVRGLSRIDFFLSEKELYFNEINTMPGFTDGSLYSRMLMAEGISEGRLFSLLIESAIGG